MAWWFSSNFGNDADLMIHMFNGDISTTYDLLDNLLSRPDEQYIHTNDYSGSSRNLVC